MISAINESWRALDSGERDSVSPHQNQRREHQRHAAAHPIPLGVPSGASGCLVGAVATASAYAWSARCAMSPRGGHGKAQRKAILMFLYILGHYP